MIDWVKVAIRVRSNRTGLRLSRNVLSIHRLAKALRTTPDFLLYEKSNPILKVRWK